MRRLLVMLALATASLAAPATPASALPCVDTSCIYICSDCIQEFDLCDVVNCAVTCLPACLPDLGCYDIDPFKFCL